MTVMDDVRRRSPLLMVSGEGGKVTVSGGSGAPSESVQYVAGAGGRVLRLEDADVTVTGVPDFTSDKSFSVLAWVRLRRGSTTRVVVERATGATRLRLEVTGDGYPSAVVSSASGGYRVTMTGSKRIDDGAWHLIVLRSLPQYVLGISVGLDALLLVDGSPVRKGWIHPGLFGRRPNLALSGPVVVGRAVSGEGQFRGDVAVVAVWGDAVTDQAVKQFWEKRPAGRTGFVGWGIRAG